MSDYLYLNEDNFFEAIENSELPMFVDFWAAWCGPCKRLDPILEEVSKNFEGRAVYAKVNVDECPNVSKKFGILSIPTVIFFDKGEVTAKEIGAKTVAVYMSHLNNLIRD